MMYINDSAFCFLGSHRISQRSWVYCKTTWDRFFWRISFCSSGGKDRRMRRMAFFCEKNHNSPSVSVRLMAVQISQTWVQVRTAVLLIGNKKARIIVWMTRSSLAWYWKVLRLLLINACICFLKYWIFFSRENNMILSMKGWCLNGLTRRRITPLIIWSTDKLWTNFCNAKKGTESWQEKDVWERERSQEIFAKEKRESCLQLIARIKSKRPTTFKTSTVQTCSTISEDKRTLYQVGFKDVKW